MPCLLVFLALSAPRLAIVLVVLFSNYLGRAYETVLWPFIGFVFMPLTTLAYASAINSRGSVAGVHLYIVALAVVIDLSLLAGPLSGRRRAPENR